MTMRWLSCGTGSMHIVATCPQCYATQGGLLLGTVGNGYAGRVSAKCDDCGKAMDYYIESAEQKVWKLDPVDSKAVRLDS